MLSFPVKIDYVCSTQPELFSSFSMREYKHMYMYRKYDSYIIRPSFVNVLYIVIHLSISCLSLFCLCQCTYFLFVEIIKKPILSNLVFVDIKKSAHDVIEIL